MHTVNLVATSERRSTDLPEKYRGVIKNGGLVWWAGPFVHRTGYDAEEAARLRMLHLLDALRTEGGA